MNNGELILGKKFKMNRGGFATVIEYRDSRNVLVAFESGNTSLVSMGNLKKGKVVDKMSPFVLGVGFVGEGVYSPSENGKNTKAYTAWANMLKRCYSKSFHKRYPSYVGCYVCEEWHNFQNFADFFNKNHFDRAHLDKDKKVHGNKLYSPETCVFLSPQKNAEVALAKTYRFTSPDGVDIKISNMRKFCRENGLTNQCMFLVASGDQKSHKGWVKSHEQ